MTGVFGYALYKIGRSIAEGYKGDNKTSTHLSGRSSYNSRSTYTGGSTSNEDDEIDDMVMMDMMDGDLDGKFDFIDKD